MERTPISRRAWLRSAFVLSAAGVLPACDERSVAISAFSKGLPPGPSTAAYVDALYAALLTWLSEQGYAASAKPKAPFSWSSNFATQTDHWFYSEKEQLRVMARRPTSEAEGLDVYVCMSVRGSRGAVEEAQQRGDRRIRALSDWWIEYQSDHPPPTR